MYDRCAAPLRELAADPRWADRGGWPDRSDRHVALETSFSHARGWLHLLRHLPPLSDPVFGEYRVQQTLTAAHRLAWAGLTWQIRPQPGGPDQDPRAPLTAPPRRSRKRSDRASPPPLPPRPYRHTRRPHPG